MAETNFEFKVVPAGEWRRLQGTRPKGTEGPRTHLVPTTERAKRFINFLALTGTYGGFCPGEIRVGEGWDLAFRFVKIDDGAEPEIMALVEEAMVRMEAACKAE